MITPSFSLTATERVLPNLALDFTTASLDPRITFTRTTSASNPATYVNNSGIVTSATNNQPRFDYNPTTLACKGLLIEESRTNNIRNNSMIGAVAGTPGTLPTNWTINSVSGITTSVVSVGTENGITYIDIKASGTPGASSQVVLNFESIVQMVASNSTAYTGSVYIRTVAGTVNNLGVLYYMLSRTSGGGNNGNNQIDITSSLSASAIINNRQTNTYTMPATNTAYVSSDLRLNLTSGLAIDITLRIGLPQVEQGAFATSVIPTTTTALTRNADVATMTGTNFSDWFNATTGASSVSIIPKSNTTTKPYLSFDDGTGLNSILLQSNTTNLESKITNLGILQTSLDSGTVTVNVNNKVCGTWNTNNCASSGNAATPATISLAIIPVVSQLRIGSDGSNYANAWMQKISYWPQRITNNETQAFSK
jgi:hypothetical protein